jgi:hypothetical protein
MITDLSLPPQLSKAEPGQVYRPSSFVFDRIPGLKELLPKHRGVPGFEYLQCAVVNLRRAQDEAWVEVDNTVIYTIEGEKGAVDMKLLCRGKRIPGQPYDSGARLCSCDKTVEDLTGLWINPQEHTEEILPEIEEEVIEPTHMSVKEEPLDAA